MRRPRNASVIPGRRIVPPVGNGLSGICTDMWRHIIWIWASCGGARCPGAPCVRARARTVCITSGGGGGVVKTHDVSWDIKSASLEKFFLPWTVQRQNWTDTLKPCHSGVSTDINILLAHHYRVFKRGLPHLAFWKDYFACLRVFVSQATALAQCAMSYI